MSNREQARYLVGINLGTSNCAVAFVEPEPGQDAPVIDFPIPQLVRAGETAERPLLPSCLYLPSEHELAMPATCLPWGEEPECIVGEFARWQGARVPGRLVTSAKSWLCHPGVNRSAPILPWGAAPDVGKLSPVEASRPAAVSYRPRLGFCPPGFPAFHTGGRGYRASLVRRGRA